MSNAKMTIQNEGREANRVAERAGVTSGCLVGGKFPMVIAHGRVKGLTVTIYRAAIGEGWSYMLTYYNLKGERKQEKGKDLAALKARAGEVLDDLASGRTSEPNGLTAHEREEAANLRSIFAEVGIAPLTGARHFVEGVKLLGADLVIEACRDYRRRNMHAASQVTVKFVCDEMPARKEALGLSERHVADLKSRLGRFAGSCGSLKLGTVTQAEIESFLDGLKDKQGKALGPRSYNNYRATLAGLFNWAKSKKYLPRDWDEMAGIEEMEDGDGEITIYTPEEMAKILNAASQAAPELVPFFALGAFAGLRSSELARLDWADVQADWIVVKGKIQRADGKTMRVAKTGKRRLVPICDNLRAWLATCRKASGPVVSGGYDSREFKKSRRAVRRESGIEFRDNAMRHSYISYRLAGTQNVNQVAMECGNSAGPIHESYKQLVTPETAREWFAVMPEGAAENVVQLNAKAAA